MLQVIIRDDAAPFLILFAVFIASFSTCFWLLDDAFQSNFNTGGDIGSHESSGDLSSKLRRSVSASIGGFDINDYMLPTATPIGLPFFASVRW